MNPLDDCTDSVAALSLNKDAEQSRQKKDHVHFLYCAELSLCSFPTQLVTDELYRTNLLQLHLQNNQLSELPPAFGRLRSLRVLYLCHNRFTTFPEVVLKLQDLLGLTIGHNQLTELPEGLHALSKLDHFACSYNRLTALPDSLF